ncbi:C163A protein, partial [Polypterus senegalus]
MPSLDVVTNSGYLYPKESCTINQFRSISLLNVDEKIFFSVIDEKRVSNCLLVNGYIALSCQKGSLVYATLIYGIHTSSNMARLVKGRGPCEGRVEVFHSGAWGTVCDDNWDMQDAAVVCRELGCGKALSALSFAHFGQGTGRIWHYHCHGLESTFSECRSAQTTGCEHYEDASVVCSAYRLVNGSNSCSGRVELYYGMQWGTVCDRYWDLQDASVVCNHLGCGYAIEVPGQASFGKGSGEIWRDNLQCKGDEADLTKCPALDYGSEECTHRHDAGVICSDQFALRLTNGTGVCDGRLEIFYNGSWGTVCDDSWDLLDANVVCRQLQCETPVNAITPVSYGPGSGHIWLDDLHCQGNESSLWDCRHQTWGQHNCRHKEDVGVNCTEFKMLRLTDGCSGQLQAFYNNSWGSVCANNMDKATAAMICQELGCGNLTSDVKEELSKLDPDPKWLDKVRCRGHEASIWQCPSSPWGKNACTRTEVAKLSCTEPLELRLVGGTNNCSGRVEIMYGDTWGTVCDDDWDLKDVKVVCRQLRCGEAVSAELEFGGGSGVIWLNKVKCRGTEAHLWDCQHEPLGKNDCVHKEDAGVKCTAYRLVSGSDSECSGRVELYYDRRWGTVCDRYWDLQDASVLCNQIGCGYAIEAPGQASLEKAKEKYGEIIFTVREMRLT